MSSFDSVPEQHEAKRLLSAALTEGPVHAYLFHGPAGVGKRELALRFAGELLGEQTRVARGSHPDLYVLEPLGDLRNEVARARRFGGGLRIRSGRFGEPVQIVATCGQHFPHYRPAYRDTYYRDRRTGGGAVQDALTHIINAGEWLVGPALLLSWSPAKVARQT